MAANEQVDVGIHLNPLNTPTITTHPQAHQLTTTAYTCVWVRASLESPSLPDLVECVSEVLVVCKGLHNGGVVLVTHVQQQRHKLNSILDLWV